MKRCLRATGKGTRSAAECGAEPRHVGGDETVTGPQARDTLASKLCLAKRAAELAPRWRIRRNGDAMLRIGLIGCGRIAKRHAELLGHGQIEGAGLAAVTDIVGAKAQALAAP